MCPHARRRGEPTRRATVASSNREHVDSRLNGMHTHYRCSTHNHLRCSRKRRGGRRRPCTRRLLLGLGGARQRIPVAARPRRQQLRPAMTLHSWSCMHRPATVSSRRSHATFCGKTATSSLTRASSSRALIAMPSVMISHQMEGKPLLSVGVVAFAEPNRWHRWHTCWASTTWS